MPLQTEHKVRAFALQIPFTGMVFVCYDPAHVAGSFTVVVTEQEYLFTLYKLRGIFTPLWVERRTQEQHEKRTQSVNACVQRLEISG